MNNLEQVGIKEEVVLTIMGCIKVRKFTGHMSIVGKLLEKMVKNAIYLHLKRRKRLSEDSLHDCMQ